MSASPARMRRHSSARSPSAEPGMDERDAGVEVGPQPVDEREGQRDLRHEHERRPSGFERRGDRLDVDRGLAAAGHAVEQERARVRAAMAARIRSTASAWAGSRSLAAGGPHACRRVASPAVGAGARGPRPRPGHVGRARQPRSARDGRPTRPRAVPRPEPPQARRATPPGAARAAGPGADSPAASAATAARPASSSRIQRS